MRTALRFFALLFLGSLGFAAELPELEQAKKDYAKLGAHPDEAARAQYLTKLVRLRDRVVKDRGNTAWKSIDAEIRRHPVAKNADAKALSALMIGKWRSPRHDYLYRKDGTQTMLPLEDGTPNGKWRIEGNQLIETPTGDARDAWRYTILLLTKTDLVFTDGEVVFYETRL